MPKECVREEVMDESESLSAPHTHALGNYVIHVSCAGHGKSP